MLRANLILPDTWRVFTTHNNIGLWCFMWFMLVCCSVQAYADNDKALRISSIIVNRVNIFAAEQALVNPLYRFANRLHKTTIENAIVRELGVTPGDSLDTARMAELERVLRGTGLFAAVSVRLQADEDDSNTAKLVVSTRDRFSIVAGANGSFLGGVGELGVTVGERNVLGLGDNFSLSLSGNTEDEVRGTISYNDFHFINGYTRAVYRAGRTEEGDFAVVRFSRPFKSTTDKRAWTVYLESRQQDVDYYENGLSVVQVPELRKVLTAEQLWRSTVFGRLIHRGLVVQFRDLEYQQVRGSQAETIDRPSDNLQVSASFVIGFDNTLAHRKVTGVDTLQFVQDLAFGMASELRLGLRHSNYRDSVEEVSPLLSARISNAVALSDNDFLKVSVSASAALSNNTSWTGGLTAKMYHRWTQQHILATRLNYVKTKSDDQLPVQYTLGENNGLRGYANRLLAGSERLQVNFEHRFRFTRKLGILDAGLIGFIDVGWTGHDDAGDSIKRAAGVGLRFGSNAMLGGDVIRMDLAYPLDDDAGENDPTFSIALGQVFTF